MDPSGLWTVWLGYGFAIAAVLTVVGLTGYGIYVAFGPPGRELSDTLDEHDD